MDTPKYRQIYDVLKLQIQHGKYEVGDYLPSENDLCVAYNITRTTARKALEELQKDGFIVRQHGKGSIVRERRESLGLLTVKGFSEVVNQKVQTEFLQTPRLDTWNKYLSYQPTPQERESECVYFSRLRFINDYPVMVEDNWLSASRVPNFIKEKFVSDSFFKTLSQHYLIEILGSEQELRALPASKEMASLLRIDTGEAILQIAIKYLTSIPDYYVYSLLNCNTNKYPIGNNYFIK